jgi:hypothetical protein
MLIICCFYTVNKKKNEEGKRIGRGEERRKYSGNREKGFEEQGENICVIARKYLCNCEKKTTFATIFHREPL